MFEIANDLQEIVTAVVHCARMECLTNLTEQAVKRCLFEQIRLVRYGYCRAFSLLLEHHEVDFASQVLQFVI